MKNYICDKEEYEKVLSHNFEHSVDHENKAIIHIVNETIANFYNLDGENICGGNLHIILDDGNLRDSDIFFCLNSCIKEGDFQGILIGIFNFFFFFPKQLATFRAFANEHRHRYSSI